MESSPPAESISINRDVGLATDLDLSFWTLLDAGRDIRIYVIALILAGTAAGWLLSYAVTPQYEAQVVAIPRDERDGLRSASAMLGQLSGLASIAGINLGTGGGSSDEIVEVLKSRLLAVQFIRDHHLVTSLLPHDQQTKDGGAEPADRILERAYNVFNKSVRRITLDKRTGIVRISMTYRDRNAAAEWANSYVDLANSAMRTRALDDYQKKVKFLNDELEKTTLVGVRQAIYELIQHQINLTMMANVEQDFALRVIDPAAVPGPREFVWPRRLMFALVGTIAGLILSFAWTVSRTGKRPASGRRAA